MVSRLQYSHRVWLSFSSRMGIIEGNCQRCLHLNAWSDNNGRAISSFRWHSASARHSAKIWECRRFYRRCHRRQRKLVYFALYADLTSRVPLYALRWIINFQQTQIFALISGSVPENNVKSPSMWRIKMCTKAHFHRAILSIANIASLVLSAIDQTYFSLYC